MFRLSERAPWFVRAVRSPVCRAMFLLSPHVRRATLANAARILGPRSTPRERRHLARGVLRGFYTFCLDVGRSTGMTPEQLRAEVGSVSGEPHYDAARAGNRGLIVVTAHMGSFEVGLAQLAARESRLNVIFRRDAQDGFERQRSLLRERLGVRENPVDDGWGMWVRLRDGLLDGETVIFQGDRVMPGQRGKVVPFCHGHIELPTGPVKLSRLTGCPIVPIFTARNSVTGKLDFFIEPPLSPDAFNGDAPGADPMLLALAATIERYVQAYPDQWLMFHPAFTEDQPTNQRSPIPSAAAVSHSSAKDGVRG